MWDLLLPGKTILFLDRGFRDCYSFLKKKGLRPLMPYCEQIKKSKKSNFQHNVNATSKSRMVTKVRFAVEKEIGYLKKLLSLDNVRDTVVGHIQIDYRIACAMHNFSFKEIRTDGKILFFINVIFNIFYYS